MDFWGGFYILEGERGDFKKHFIGKVPGNIHTNFHYNPSKFRKYEILISFSTLREKCKGGGGISKKKTEKTLRTHSKNTCTNFH